MTALDYHKHVSDIAHDDAVRVLPRDELYQGSWQRRGGVGIFLTAFCRKWDRIESAAKQHGYDIIRAWQADPGETGLIDDIRDLRRYLLLFEALLTERHGLGQDPDSWAGMAARSQTDRQDRVLDSQLAHGDTGVMPSLYSAFGKAIAANKLHEHDPHDQAPDLREKRRPGSGLATGTPRRRKTDHD